MAFATLDARTTDAVRLDAARLGEFILLRIATSTEGLAEPTLARDLHPYVAQMTRSADWRLLLARLVAALVTEGLIVRERDTLRPTPAGVARMQPLLAHATAAKDRWAAARDGALMARALGLEATTRRLRQLAKLDGLKAAVVESAWQLRIKGAATPARLRDALALVALERAFGNQIKSGLGTGSALSAKAARMLAGQLSTSRKSFGTDARLVSALATEATGVRSATLPALRLAVLRRYLTLAPFDLPPPPDEPVPTALAPAIRDRPHVVEAPRAETSAPPPPITPPQAHARPDPAGFAREVLALGRPIAEGWEGNRKVFISRVWEAVRQHRAGWGLSEIEFKCMLTEAHRLGLLVLANSDLKDKRQMKELQDSATVYKNTVWHYVRVIE